MSRNTTRHLITLGAIRMIPISWLISQPSDNSPLSRFGLGELSDQNFVAAFSQGGIGSAFWHLHQANLVNPASGHLEATALETGVFAKHSTLKRNDFSSGVWSGNMEYFSLSFPILNPINIVLERREREFGWGMNVSLTPFSHVGYSITSHDLLDSIGMVTRSFQGTGGLYRVNWGNGWRYKDLCVGLNVGYLFGRTSYSTQTDFDDIAYDYSDKTRSDISYRTFIWNTGIQYDIRLPSSERNNRRFITLGAHYTLRENFDSKQDYISYAQSVSLVDADTSVYVTGQEGSGRLPSEFGIGVRIQESNVWSAGIDYSRAAWSKYFNTARPDTLRDTWRLGVGMTYTPDFSSISSYLSRVEYRAGIFYQKDPRVLEGEQAFRYGVTLGAGMPFVFLRSFSYVNLGLEYGESGDEKCAQRKLFSRQVRNCVERQSMVPETQVPVTFW